MKKVLKILTLIMLILTIFKIADTYAKYYTRATAAKEQAVGQWVIKLNETDIYSETGATVDFEMNIDNLVADTNTMAGKISPGSTWYSDIIINTEGTDVAVKYDIQVDPSQITNANLDIPYTLSIVGGTKTLKRTGANTYTGIISLAEIQENSQETIRCTLVWNNTGGRDTEDTQLATTAGQKIQVPVKVTCTQYLGEQIFEYTP